MRTNFSKEFVFLRDLLDEGDLKKILGHLGRFEIFYMELNRQMNKFIKTGVNTVAICSGDLKDLCDLTEPLLSKWIKQVHHNKMHKELWNCEQINSEHFNTWGKKYTDLFSVIAKLRCFLSVISYAYCMLEAYEIQDEQNNDLTTVVVNAIKNHMRTYY